jgi:radical SAM protein with 4Fe4S-binding SPASM domain
MDKIFPILKDNYALHLGPKQSFIYQFIFGSNNMVYLVNTDAAKILEMCDGNTSLDKIVQNFAKSQDSYESMFETFKSYLENSIFVELHNQHASNNFRVTGNWNFPTPTHVSIELTYQCNFSCKHCYCESSPSETQLWNKEKLFEVIKDLASSGIQIIELTGGEPLIHPDFMPILELCSQSFPLIGINTNGYLLNEDHIKPFLKLKNRLFFQVGLEGDNPEYVDDFCDQEGAFENSKKAIQILSKEGFITRAAMTVTPKNLDQMRSTARLAKKLGATNFIISTVVPMGRGRSHDLIFSSGGLPELFEEAEALKEELGDFVFDAPEALTKDIYDEDEHLNCGAGSRSICITPNGDVKMCPMSNPNDLYFGNVYIENLNTIFSRSLPLVISEVKDPRPKICGSCEHIDYCGYCLARGIQRYNETGKSCPWGKTKEVASMLKEAQKIERQGFEFE